MSGTWTMYGRAAMLSSLLAPDTFVPLGTLALALTRSVPVANATAAQLIEPVGGGYARRSYAADGAHWSATDFGELFNSQAITFASVTSSWGLIVGWALLHPGSGQCIAVGSIADPYVAAVGMVPSVAAGALLMGNYD